MQHQFPLEILEKIIQNLSEYRPALRSCSLVSSPFRFLSQTILFERIAVTVASDGPDFWTDGLLDLLSCKPNLAKYVKFLVVQVDASTPSLLPSDDYGRFNKSLPELPRLHTLILRSKNGNSATDWSSMTPMTRSNLISLLQQSTTTRFSLENLQRFPIQILRHCPQLHRASFHRVNLVDANHSDPKILEVRTASHPLGFLESLSVDENTPFSILFEVLTDKGSHLSLSRLRQYSGVVSSEEKSALAIRKILQLCHDSLEEVRLQVGGGPFFTAQFVNLKGLYNLRRFDVELFGQAVSYINDIYPTLPLNNSIVELKISITPGLTGTGGGTKAWHELDELLTEERHGSRLERVTVRTMSAWLISPAGFLSQALPKLSSRGILRIEDRFGSALNFHVVR